ncbi:bifunctional [glutamine synthetase] adenylyltransferase/[glutamine synthetase]-adenylyl-L-tyrosine phosphorylase [Quadrisphaera sp. DSM 44207]|uniref:bifunctional [glutamine synthetase] adenylyltransferase/[glutamine synthetase]-adenylyl-L-tyrosine phosphorylase n=1 Tax=Quadrisphaera sp. DSM 44207 TaxID=1881057 RepID=UPI00087F0462|nr:bifunctional [glutamine synthetase] adenylyltransferase/[glutamine synthetase]-adenylyl-L-tyrosine phosphorylase [Quadrisphaera sp. DSM 44207]SDQ04120.1 glutamate-ammonia-ligase adenylyltransferase [Quadrisphaera sp. DSM 44207]
MTTPRAASTAGTLARLGFTDPPAAARLLSDPALARLAGTGADVEELLAALARTPDPDRGLLALVRLLEALGRPAVPAGVRAGVQGLLAEDGVVRRRLLAVLGGSVALGEHLVRHPEHWEALRVGPHRTAAQVRADLLAAVGADPQAPVPVASSERGPGRDALRVAYRRRLLTLAAVDLADPEPVASVDVVTGHLADLADAALEAALALARAVVPGAPAARLAVIAMGKCGAQELNYVSDVDVVHVVAPAQGCDEATALRVGAQLAAELASACSAATAEGTLWPVDAGLRPEGRDGPLVRTLDSHVAYYRRWARTWEFQALLKARPAAGDAELGAAYAEAVGPMVWSAADRPDLVPDTQAMRRRVEEHVPAKEADRQLKLGRGGLRDVEFGVQLLQLVHGRTEPALRVAATLEALERLSAFGYVGRHDAAALDRDYRFLRVLEHRLQLHRLRRTQLVPEDDADLRRLARAAGVPGGADGLRAEWAAVRRRVRRLHELFFYRPLLAAAAQLSTDEVQLTPDAARARLAALGYRDPAGALRHIAALSSGVSRRAAIQRQLLPVMLGWFADGADPDGGLLSFRRISERLGGTHWYLKMLRDEGAAAQRMAAATASSRFVAAGLERDAEATRWLGTDADLLPRDPRALAVEASHALARQEERAAAAAVVRRLRARELLRTALGDVLGLVEPERARAAISAATAAALDAALAVAVRAVVERTSREALTRVAVVGMGRLGGAEMGYGSDADVLFVHDPLPGASAAAAQEQALAIVGELRRVLTAPGPEPALEVDAKLRPEGRDGPLARSLASYREYYGRWAQPWEAQALLRAVPVAGDPALGAAFLELVDPVRFPPGGAGEAVVREVRRVKARVEAERLPRGVDPRRHLKLGPGGLADVEWTAQLLQMRHAAEVPALRATSTTGALAAAVGAGVLDGDDAAVLDAAWRTVSRARDALVLRAGRPTDVLPSDVGELEAAARLAGHPAGSANAFDEDVRRHMRRARRVVERVFYG